MYLIAPSGYPSTLEKLTTRGKQGVLGTTRVSDDTSETNWESKSEQQLGVLGANSEGNENKNQDGSGLI